MMNTALLLSGGTGSRIQTDIPKQYICVGGRMLITYALKTLSESPLIGEIEIVAEEVWREAILEDAQKASINVKKISGFADPGQNRQSSIMNGLKNILWQRNGSMDITKPCDKDTVLIHDAARPFLSQKLIQSCYEALGRHDGVMPALPMKDTVYLSRDGVRVEELLERSHLYAGQAPEVFLLKKYYMANMVLSQDKIMKINGSTEPAILAGMDIVMIPGDESNYKITTKTDLDRFQECIQSESKKCFERR